MFKTKEKIIIVDFGSQVTKLIARRIRDLGVFSEIVTLNDLKKIYDFSTIKGIILSGGPATVNSKNFPIANSLVKKVLAFPHHQHLKRNEIEFVCKKINNFYKK